MKSHIKSTIFVLVLFLLGFHGCVVKAQRQMQVRSCYDLREKNTAAYDQCVNRITYVSTLMNLHEVLHAWD